MEDSEPKAQEGNNEPCPDSRSAFLAARAKKGVSKPTSKWAAISLLFFCLSIPPFCFIGLFLPWWLTRILFIYPVPFLLSIVCAILALVQIKRSQEKMDGKIIAFIGLGGSIFLILANFYIPLLPLSYHIIALQNKLSSPAIYNKAAVELAQYCQAVTTEVKDIGLGNAWYPDTIRNLNPHYGSISPKDAHIVFASGFYHLGYKIELDENASTEKQSVWNLSMLVESGEKSLCSVRLDKTNPFTLDKLIETAVAGYNSIPEQAHNKIIFLLIFDRPEMAYQACKELTEKYPKDWWPRLTLAFMDAAKTDPNKVGDDFATWIEKHPSFSNYYYLSFFYQKENDPQKACYTVEKSLGYPIKEDEHSEGARNVYSYVSDSIAIALKNNKQDLALRICNIALAGLEKEHGKYSSAPYWKPTLQKLKTAIVANDQNTIGRWNEYQAWGGSFNPYRAGNTNAIQRIKVGSHFFPSDEDIRASQRPFEEIEPLTKEWSSRE
ncbi:MAG: DUF4190 domain-containing protein [Sedimentisphaerales bacterium]